MILKKREKKKKKDRTEGEKLFRASETQNPVYLYCWYQAIPQGLHKKKRI